MNNIKKVLSAWMLVACVLPVAAQYPVIPDSVKARGAKQEAEFERKSDAAWEKALPTVLEEAKKGRPYKPWASKPEDLIKSNIPAFPGAEGGGMYTPGGRGGKVIVVTSLEDSGPGTLREACETGGARIIVFNVAGVIRLKSPISVRAPYVTIAGQTAPGDGICVTGQSFLIDTHDVVIRHMRFRRGAQDVAFRDDAVGGNAVGNIMVDHCSASWGLDENMSIYRHVYNRGADGHGLKLPTVNITIQNSIFSEALDTYNHAFGATIGGHNSFYNMINNYFKPGPITPIGKPISYRILKPEAGRDKNRPLSFGKAYVNGNIIHGNAKVTKDNWDGGVQLKEEVDAAKFLPLIKSDEAFKMPPVTVMDTKKAYTFVLDNVGANFPKRDAVDARVIKTVQTGKAIYAKDAPEFVSPYVKRRLPADSYKQGIITDIRQVGGLPEYKGEAVVDSDGDGMPDAWEIANGLNPNDPTDANMDCNGDGYTNIEKYINGIDTRKKVDWTDLKNNYDTLSKRKSLL